MPVYITEYAELARDAFSFHVPAGKEPAIAEQQRTVSGASAQSSAFNNETAFIMVHTSESAHLAFGTSPTAVTTAHKLAAGETRYYGVPKGKSFKLAAIAGA